MIGPWKLFRIIWRLVLTILGAWLLLALLWAFLPFPSDEQHGDDGTDDATNVLLGGKTLRRVYLMSVKVPDDAGHFADTRQGFALDYKLNISNLTLAVSGLEQPLRILSGEGNEYSEQVTVAARAGDTDGANLPWFPPADSILLFWQIHREYASVPLAIQRSAEETGDVQKLDIFLNVQRHKDDPLLSLKVWKNDTSTIRASVPLLPLSSSPSYTYPVRAAIIQALAPLSITISAVVQLLWSLFSRIVSWTFMAICLGLVVSIVAAMGMYYLGKRPHELVDMAVDELQKLRDSEVMKRWREPDSDEGDSAGNSKEQKTSSAKTEVSHV